MKWVLAVLTWLLSLFASREATRSEAKSEVERQQAEAVTAQVVKANEAQSAADKDHAEDPTDGAFDKDFRRS